MTKIEILITRALNNAARHLRNGSKSAAKNAYDNAYGLYTANKDQVTDKIVLKHLYWVRENYYPLPTFKNSYHIAVQPDYEGAILAREGH